MTLRAESISHRIAERVLFDALTLQIEPGRLQAVIGPNGAGKSTLLRTLVGLLAPQTGCITLAGARLPDIPARLRARALAYLPQSPRLTFDLTVEDIVMLGRSPHGGRFARESQHDRTVVATSLAKVGLAGLGRRASHTLSGGELQRVMLARMLATEARFFVLDEPTLALDIGHTLAFFALCRELVDEGHGFCIVTHELELARRHADEVLCLLPDGTHVLGAPSSILSADVLQRAFGVRLQTEPGALAFASPEVLHNSAP